MQPDYFGPNGGGPAFVLLSAQHLLALLAMALVCVLIATLTPRLGPRGRKGLRWGLVGFCALNWLGWDAWQLAYGLWSPAYSLPLHLCTLSVPLCALMLATRSFRLFELLYFWAFAGAVNAMLTPDLQVYGFPHFRYWIFWTSHGVILWAVVFAASAWSYRPAWRSVLTAFLLTNAYLLVVGLANWLTGGNYMFVARRPEYPTLIDVLGPWPWYILVLEAIALVAFVIVYLPYALVDLRRRLRPV